MLKTFTEFREWANAPVGGSASRSGSTTAQDPKRGSGGSKGRSGTTVALKPFLAKHKLRGNKEKAAAILAWSAESGKQETLSIDEAEAEWKKSGFKVPKNMGRDMRAAEKEGWLDSTGSGKAQRFGINAYGESQLSDWASDKE